MEQPPGCLPSGHPPPRPRPRLRRVKLFPPWSTGMSHLHRWLLPNRPQQSEITGQSNMRSQRSTTACMRQAQSARVALQPVVTCQPLPQQRPLSFHRLRAIRREIHRSTRSLNRRRRQRSDGGSHRRPPCLSLLTSPILFYFLSTIFEGSSEGAHTTGLRETCYAG